MAAITPADAHKFLNRWNDVERVQNALDRQQTIESRLRVLSTLMSSRELFGTDPAREVEIEQLRQRWLRLRATCGG